MIPTKPTASPASPVASVAPPAVAPTSGGTSRAHDSFPSGYSRRLLGFAAALACLGGLALSIDLPVARWFKDHRPPSELMRLLNFSEVFAHGTGVAVILLAATVLDRSLAAPIRRPQTWRANNPDESRNRSPSGTGATPKPSRGWQLDSLFRADVGRLVAAAYTGGLIVDVIKALVDRVRPRAADLVNAASALATFGEQATAGLVARGFSSHSDFNSFPSGHSATAAGLAAALAWKYPHGGMLFAVLAGLGATQRVATLAHYPSDVLLGLALGLLGAAMFLGKAPTGGVADAAVDSAARAGVKGNATGDP
jgi:membrane-associated phospholipid phosphatase